MGHALHLWLVSGLVHRTVNGEVSRRFLQGDTITVTETIATTTITSTIDPCIGAQDACACAAGLICGWSAFANGGGICQNRGEPTNIDCFICGAQEKCPKNCPQLTSACECAASTGCAWDLGFGQCVVSTASTDCRACSTQAGCDVNPPVLVESGYSPANGGSHSSGADLKVVLQFDKTVTWCSDATGSDAAFWCSGSVNDQTIPRTRMTFTAAALTIDMKWHLSSMSLTNERTCGIWVGVDRICDQDGAAFAGLPKSAYSFQLLDQIGPSLVGFDPTNQYELVPLDGSVTLLWSEAIMLNPVEAEQQATLSRLEVDSRGLTTVAQSFTISLKDTSEIVSSTWLRINLDGLIRSGKLYTLSLPAGAVTDLAGNPGDDLPAEAFPFRAATASNGGSVSVPASSNSVGVVIVVVCVAVFCILGGGIGVVKLYRSHAAALSNFLPKQKVKTKAKSTLQMNPPTVEKDKSIPSFATANAAAETAYRAAAAAAERLRSEDEGGSKPATNATNASWAQRPSSKAGTGNATKPSPKVFPERDGFNAGRARRSSPVNEGGKSDAKAASAPTSDSNLPPEVQAVEKKLHDLMDEPIATRRKLFKELLVEYHPDKNSSSHAKEVFQYVNNARSWFLVES